VSATSAVKVFSKYFHSIAHSPVSVLPSKHAQMEARTTEAAQKGPCQDRRESGSFAAGLLCSRGCHARCFARSARSRATSDRTRADPDRGTADAGAINAE